MADDNDPTTILKMITDFRKVPCRVSMAPSSNYSLDTSEFTLVKKRKLNDSDTTERRKDLQAESSYCESPWEFRRLRSELIESKAQIIRLEDRIDQLHKKNKEQVIFFDKEKSEMKLQLDANRNTIKDLERRLNIVRKREAECKEELNEYVRDTKIKMLKYDQGMLEREKENDELRERIKELESKTDENIQELESEIVKLRKEVKSQQLNAEEQKALCTTLEAQLAVALQDQKDMEELKLELQSVQIKVKDLEYEKQEYEEARIMVTALQSKVLHVEQIEKELVEKKQEVKNLREAVHSKLVLEEMIHDFKLKLAGVEEREKEAIQLKTRNTTLEIEVEEWKTLAKCFNEGSNVTQLKCYIEELQRKQLDDSIEINSLTSKVSTFQKKNNILEDDLKLLREKYSKLQDSFQKVNSEVQVLRKKLNLVTRERDSYREQLDLYEKDLTITGIDSESVMNERCTQQRSRIKTLESSLADYRSHVATLEKQLKQYLNEGETVSQLENVEKLQSELFKLKKTVDELQKRNDELEIQLEEVASKGGHLPAKTKTIHLKKNPTSELHAKLTADHENLKAECDKLRARVKLLEEGEHLDLTRKAAESAETASSERMQALEEQLKSSNIKIQRLKEVFKKTSQDFRNVCYMLLGYKIDSLSEKAETLYRLTSMYSESADQYLIFKLTKGGMEMLESEFSKTLSDLVQEHLHQENSIPAFLSALTLSLHSSCVQSSSSDDSPEEVDLT